MTTVVLVHGIAQEQYGADRLERSWVPDMAGGVRATHLNGSKQCADTMIRGLDHREDFDVRMAFYGDLFLDSQAQGTNDSLADMTSEQRRFAEELALEWLVRAATRPGHPDKDRAKHLADALTATSIDQGVRHRLEAGSIRAASRVPWLAVGGMSFAESFVRSSLRQVTLYMTDPEIRRQVHRRIDALTTFGTRVMVAHSLGSVAAYEYLSVNPHKTIELLVTMGSPLGLRTIIYERLVTHEYPNNVGRWINIVDRNDLIACEWNLQPLFAHTDKRFVNVATVDNGARPHDPGFYLSKRQTGAPILEALLPMISSMGM